MSIHPKNHSMMLRCDFQATTIISYQKRFVDYFVVFIYIIFISIQETYLSRCIYVYTFLCDILILYSNYGYFQWNQRSVGSVAVPKSSLMIINYPIIIFWWYWYIWAFRYQDGINRGLNVPPFTIYMRSIIVQRFSNYKDKEYKN